MNKQTNKLKMVRWGTSLLLGMSVWVFFAIFYRQHMHYQEQMQFFLFTSDYLTGFLSRPGGFSTYLGNFFTQFFYDSFLGAFWLALLMVALQWLVLKAAEAICRMPLTPFLSCLPSLACAVLLMDENYLLSGPVALILSLVAVVAAFSIKRNVVRLAFYLLMIPVLYWFTGMACVVFVLLFLSFEWLKEERIRMGWLAGVSVAGILFLVLCPFAAKMIVVQYPLKRFWFAGDYYRYVLLYSLLPMCAFLPVVLIPLLYKWLAVGWQLLLLAVLIGWGFVKMADWQKEEIMAYDYYARTQKWNNIIAKADKHAPDGPLTVATLNLALSKRDFLPQYMFTYYQNGTGGLVPSAAKEYIICVIAGEIYYHLGMVNAAQHLAFEAMEAIPDYQKSVRCIKRLAETNLINGEYAVAEKYLRMLRYTLFYRKWADETMTYLWNEEKINAHPEWGTLRAYRTKNDFLFSDEEVDMMCGILFQQNNGNRMAYEYLLAYTLLKKDLEHFQLYYRMGVGTVPYKQLPTSYQEALAYIWSLTKYDMALKPAGLSDQVVKRLEAYRRAYTNTTDPKSLLEKDFGNTYWFYYHFR